MTFYSYASHILQSSMAIGELPIATSASNTDNSFIFRKFNFAPPELNEVEYAHQPEPETCQPYQSLTRSGDKLILRFFEHADFLVSKDGRKITVRPQQDTTSETIIHLLLDQVLPRLLDLQGHLLIHASSVRVGKDAIAFIGESGAGKSTVSASFHLHGHQLLSDDGLLIKLVANTVSAVPTYRSLRLWPDTISYLYKENPVVAPVAHYSDKCRVLSECSTLAMMEAHSLAIIYLLDPTDDKVSETVSITQLRPIEACMAIISNSFQLDVNDKKRAAERLKQAAQISRMVPVFRLQYHRDFSRLPALRAAILKHYEQTTKSPENKFTTSPLVL